MKVIVFGATGSVGRLAVKSLLADGHEVTAFARRPRGLEISHPRLKRLAGNAMKLQEVCSAIAGQ
ncbi:MAG: NAD(P)H-binding protein, partial [Halioglobus sp.]